MEKFGKRTITVNGTPVELNVDIDLHVGALSGDMDKVASQMGFWGSVWASAVEERVNVDAHYRRWRALLAEQLLSQEPKLAEWKLRAKIEAHPEFVKMKAAIGIAERNVILSKAVFESFDKKSNQLQSKGAMSRSELDATAMTTSAPSKTKAPRSKPPVSKRAVPEPKHFPDSADDRVSAMRGMFNKE